MKNIDQKTLAIVTNKELTHVSILEKLSADLMLMPPVPSTRFESFDICQLMAEWPFTRGPDIDKYENCIIPCC